MKKIDRIMKKFFISLAILVLFTGCNTVELTPEYRGSSLTACMGGETKTSVSELYVYWTSGDKMTIIDGTNEYIFTAAGEGQVTRIVNDEVTLSGIGTYYGFYPASKFNGFNADSKTFTGEIPITQYIDVAGGKNWDPTAPALVGKGLAENRMVAFYNANALIEFMVPAKATRINFNTQHPVSGPFTAKLGTGSNITITPATGAAINFTVLPHKSSATSGHFAANTQYYVACLPKQVDSDVYIIVDYTEAGGNIESAGKYFYNFYLPPLTTVVDPMGFLQNKITRMDLGQAHPIKLEGPLSSVKPEGSYICIGPDGNALFSKTGNGNDFKYEQLHLTVYVTDTGVDDILLEGASGNQSGTPSGTHSLSAEAETIGGVPMLKFCIHNPYYTDAGESSPTTHNGSYWLASSINHPGCFKLVANEADAAYFEVYRFSNTPF